MYTILYITDCTSSQSHNCLHTHSITTRHSWALLRRLTVVHTTANFCVVCGVDLWEKSERVLLLLVHRTMCKTEVLQSSSSFAKHNTSPLQRRERSHHHHPNTPRRSARRVTFSSEDFILGQAQVYDRRGSLRQPCRPRVQSSTMSAVRVAAAESNANFCGMWRRSHGFNWAALLELSGVDKASIPEQVRVFLASVCWSIDACVCFADTRPSFSKNYSLSTTNNGNWLPTAILGGTFCSRSFSPHAAHARVIFHPVAYVATRKHLP